MGTSLQQRNIIDGFRKNDPEILKEIYLVVYPKVRGFILKNNGDDHRAKDIFQEAFIACWKNIKNDKVMTNSNIEAYLYTIAKNKWTDYLRSADYKKRVSANEIGPLTVVEDEKIEDETLENNKKALKEAWEQLGENCKNLLNMFYFERKSMEDISKVMNIASTSARNQKYRCMEKLRTLSLEIKSNGK